jgi:hypothetical protein
MANAVGVSEGLGMGSNTPMVQVATPQTEHIGPAAASQQPAV